MRIVTLMENTAASPEMACGHGLSFYIETKNHRILFDMGPDGSFLENARKLGVDVSRVDMALLSHGHYDHGGGLPAFLEANAAAPVHVQKRVFGEFYSKRTDGTLRYIGLPKELEGNPRLVLHSGDYKLDAGLQVFAGITGRECYSPANDRLLQKVNGHEMQDLFMHEQNLLIKEGSQMVLIAGCAHNGIVNILKKAQSLAPGGITHVIGGMHLKDACPEEEQMRSLCRSIAEKLSAAEAMFYTCHCTSPKGYRLLREEMGEQIRYLPAGSVLKIPEASPAAE